MSKTQITESYSFYKIVSTPENPFIEAQQFFWPLSGLIYLL